MEINSQFNVFYYGNMFLFMHRIVLHAARFLNDCLLHFYNAKMSFTFLKLMSHQLNNLIVLVH